MNLEEPKLDQFLKSDLASKVSKSLEKDSAFIDMKKTTTESTLKSSENDDILATRTVTDVIEKTKAKDEEATKAINLSELKGAKRLPKENFTDYKIRLKREKAMIKKYLQGKIIWKSIFEGTFRREKKEEKD